MRSRLLLGLAVLALLVGIGGVVIALTGPDVGRVDIVYGRPDSDELELGVETCNAELTAEMVETASRVEVRVTHPKQYGSGDGDCKDSIKVLLNSPLGNRDVVDADSRQSIPMLPAE